MCANGSGLQTTSGRPVADSGTEVLFNPIVGANATTADKIAANDRYVANYSAVTAVMGGPSVASIQADTQKLKAQQWSEQQYAKSVEQAAAPAPAVSTAEDPTLLAAKKNLEAENQSLAIQKQALDSTMAAEKKRNDDIIAGKQYAAEEEAASYEKQKSLLGSADSGEDERQRKLRAQSQKRTVLGGN